MESLEYYYGRPEDRLYYHYTTCESAFKYILPDKQLRLSPYTKMRDPFEAQPWGFTFSGPKLPGIHEALTDAIAATHARHYVLSVTGDAGPLPTQRGYGRARMWEQYARNHEGVCLIFGQDALHKLVTGYLPKTVGGAVRYSTAGFLMSWAHIVPDLGLVEVLGRLEGASASNDDAQINAVEQELRSLLPDIPNEMKNSVRGNELFMMFATKQWLDYFNSIAMEVYLLKDIDFAGEIEFRYVHFDPDPSKEFVYVPIEDSLRAVVLGHRFPEERIAEAIERTAPGVDLLGMRWVNRWPEPVPIR